MGKILIIADRKGSEIATPRGLALAAKLGMAVEVVAFVHVSLKQLKVSAPEQVRIRKQMLAEREKLIQTRIDKHSVSGQRVKLKVLWEKDVAAWVNKRCAAADYEAVVKTGRRTETLIHTSTDWQLLRECPAPVLILSAKKWSRTQPVMACLDLASDASVKRKLNGLILGKAKQLSEELGTPHNTLSFHLNHLSSAGIVSSRKEGRSVIYSANFDVTRDLIGFMVKDCCSVEFASIREDKKTGCSIIELANCYAAETKAPS